MGGGVGDGEAATGAEYDNPQYLVGRQRTLYDSKATETTYSHITAT